MGRQRDHATNYSAQHETARMMTPFLASKLFGSIESNPTTSRCPLECSRALRRGFFDCLDVARAPRLDRGSLPVGTLNFYAADQRVIRRRSAGVRPVMRLNARLITSALAKPLASAICSSPIPVRSNDCGRRHLALGGAFALASLFGKLPATRAPHLKELKRKTVAKA